MLSPLLSPLRAAFCALALSPFALAATWPVDLSQPTPKPEAWFKELGGVAPNGMKYDVNQHYMTRDGKAWLPVMGEFHYNRYPSNEWDRQLKRMKAGGVTIVATYVLWVNHEKSKGVWDWTGDNDLRRFVQLCQKNGLYVWMRPGPYCNAESRNGGFPDFINKMPNKRSVDAAFMAEVDRLYAQVGEQLKGLMVKDGGPIVGVQLDNEAAHVKPDYIEALRKLALKHGLKAPYFTVTANSHFHWKEGTVLPLQGAYPYRGWGAPGFPTNDFLYRSEAWGAMFNEVGQYYDIPRFPLGFCEMGAGCWYNYGNRFIVKPEVSVGLLQDTLGRGSNQVGYYMFQGGTQKAGTEMGGHPLTYDFQAPLGEFGHPYGSYAKLRVVHSLLRDFGTQLAPCRTVYPEKGARQPRDTTNLRYVVRHVNGSGFLFLNNTQVWVDLPDRNDLTLEAKLPGGETLTFPQTPFTLKGGSYAILPLNLDINGVRIAYAMSQPLARIESEGKSYCFFFTPDGIAPEYAFSTDTVKSLKGQSTVSGKFTVAKPAAGLDSAFTVVGKDGRETVFVTLTREQAESSWRMNVGGRERLLISDAEMLTENAGVLSLVSRNPKMSLRVFPGAKKGIFGGVFSSGASLFSEHQYAVKPVTFAPEMKKVSPQEWSFTVKSLPAELEDVRADIDYIADTGDLLVDGKKYSDRRYNGDKWTIGLNRFFRPDSGAHTFTVKINAFNPRIGGIANEHQPKNDAEKAGLIRDIVFSPEYRVELRSDFTAKP